jgi:hypothetical protein
MMKNEEGHSRRRIAKAAKERARHLRRAREQALSTTSPSPSPTPAFPTLSENDYENLRLIQSVQNPLPSKHQFIKSHWATSARWSTLRLSATLNLQKASKTDSKSAADQYEIIMAAPKVEAILLKDARHDKKRIFEINTTLSPAVRRGEWHTLLNYYREAVEILRKFHPLPPPPPATTSVIHALDEGFQQPLLRLLKSKKLAERLPPNR